ncbi:phage/plasmid replication domain-containing protein [Pontibacter ruber]|uniref:Phage/plasmid replication protein n=1 Tax=Pontibacter ruber TaxID=1343895 RepID=A0ABW5CV72_9BACT|nr:phage/plasmid replication protein [Pontibacter ruber]
MLDTTKLFLSQVQAGFSIEACLQNLTNVSENYRRTTEEVYITGYAGNLRVGVSEHGVTITGSLPKFYTGTNIHTLNRSDCRRAFEMMADTLHLPIQRAKVKRVDVGLNLLTDHKPELYYPYLGESRYYKRLTQPTAVNYQNKLRTKKAYDKIAESKSKGVAIPEVYAGKNLLRFEVCYMQRLQKEFNQAFITPDVLTKESFYMGLIDRWHKEYESIKKTGLPKMDKSKMRTAKGFWSQIDSVAVKLLGQELLLNLTEEMKEGEGFTTSREYYRIREQIIDYASGKSDEEPELIQELNKKVARAKQHYR